MTSVEDPGRLQSRILSGQPGTSRAVWAGDPALPWKANLIALSQVESLYFVALNETIYVDRPNVAVHPLNGDTASDLRWRLPATTNAACATHHHNSRYPHGVNRLEISFLGDQEVLGCVCDDGDVVIYLVSVVQAVFDAIDEGSPQETAIKKFLRPLYHYNVGKSAWGLATQRESRLIAVSSNRAEICLRAAALCPDETSSSSKAPTILRQDGSPLGRTIDRVWTLRGHETNIPAVNFHCSGGTEPTVFLLSSDIDNNVFIWNVSCGSQLICKINIEYHDPTRQHGWLVFPVAPQVFRLVNDPENLHGAAPELECGQSTNVVSLGVPSTLDEDIEQLTGSLSSDSADSSVGNLPFSLVHTSTERVSLLHKPFNRIASCFVAPWRTETPPFQDHHGTFGIMRYARFVPELGIIVAGSDLGYVGVFTLTRLNRENQNETGYGMRLDLILPFQDQIPPESRLLGFSGFGCLIGIATAPMPGTVKGRYRLVLEYTNRTLLTYELWRDMPSL